MTQLVSIVLISLCKHVRMYALYSVLRNQVFSYFFISHKYVQISVIA